MQYEDDGLSPLLCYKKLFMTWNSCVIIETGIIHETVVSSMKRGYIINFLYFGHIARNPWGKTIWFLGLNALQLRSITGNIK